MPVVFPSGWANPRTIIQAHNEENVVIVRLARYLHLEVKRAENERGSVLSLVARLSIFLAFSASRNISPVLTLLARGSVTRFRGRLAVYYTLLSLSWLSVPYDRRSCMKHLACICYGKKDKTNLEFETKVSNIIPRLHETFLKSSWIYVKCPGNWYPRFGFILYKTSFSLNGNFTG